MAYKLTDYRRCGPLWYPVKFLPNGSIKVIDEPKDEREIWAMAIESKQKEMEEWIRARRKEYGMV